MAHKADRSVRSLLDDEELLGPSTIPLMQELVSGQFRAMIDKAGTQLDQLERLSRMLMAEGWEQSDAVAEAMSRLGIDA